MISKSDWARLRESAEKLLGILERLPSPMRHKCGPLDLEVYAELMEAMPVFKNVAEPVREAWQKNYREISDEEKRAGAYLACFISGTLNALVVLGGIVKGVSEGILVRFDQWRENLRKVVQCTAMLAEEEKPE